MRIKLKMIKCIILDNKITFVKTMFFLPNCKKTLTQYYNRLNSLLLSLAAASRPYIPRA